MNKLKGIPKRPFKILNKLKNPKTLKGFLNFLNFFSGDFHNYIHSHRTYICKKKLLIGCELFQILYILKKFKFVNPPINSLNDSSYRRKRPLIIGNRIRKKSKF